MQIKLLICSSDVLITLLIRTTGISKAMLKKLLVWHCRPGGSQGGSVDPIFFFTKQMEVSASNLFEMQAKLYAELTDDIFRYYSVPKNSLLEHKTSLSEPLSEAIKPTIVAILNGFSDVLHFATGVALQCGDLHAISRFTSLDTCIHLRKSLY